MALKLQRYTILLSDAFRADIMTLIAICAIDIHILKHASH